MKPIVFATAQDAETAFYEAFENCDINAMMAVWADEEEIVCVHPSGARLTGVLKIRESWRQIFSSGIKLNFRVTDQQYVTGLQLAIHSVYEHITVVGETKSRNPVVATNIYMLTERGWRMLMHHASQVPDKTVAPIDPAPTTLH
jgi:ketosteroid isomerase-like protein